MRVLVTGGLGVIGVRVVRKLLERGIQPVVYDFRPDFWLMPDLVGRFEFVAGDVTDFGSVNRVVRDQHIERIVHLAAFIDPDMGKLAFRSFNVNTLGTVNLLEAARLGH